MGGTLTSGSEAHELNVDRLSIGYKTHRGVLKAVDDVSLRLAGGRIHALVGESGCGKSTLGLALSRLLPARQVQYSGKVIFKGIDLLSLEEDEVDKYRGTGIATIFQEPMTSLNPVYKVGEQIAEAYWVKERSSKIYRQADQLQRPNLRTVLLGGSTTIAMFRRNYLERMTPQVLEILR